MRAELVALLVARGFSPADSQAFAARLSDAQVAEDLRWHQWEAQHYAAGPPSSWSTAVRQQINAHYLGPAHRLAGFDLMAMQAANLPARQAPATPSGAGVAILGTLLVLTGAAVAYTLARRG